MERYQLFIDDILVVVLETIQECKHYLRDHGYSDNFIDEGNYIIRKVIIK